MIVCCAGRGMTLIGTGCLAASTPRIFGRRFGASSFARNPWPTSSRPADFCRAWKCSITMPMARRNSSSRRRNIRRLLKPSDGATLAAFDFRPASATLINSIMRRREAYHARLREAAASAPSQGGAVSIHDQVHVKEPNLERFLRYDRFARHSFRLLLFEPWRTPADYEALQLNEVARIAAGAFQVRNSSANHANLVFERELAEFAANPAEPPVLKVTKHFLFGPAPQGCEVSCEVTLSLTAPLGRALLFGLESVINFLAPADADRFFVTPAGPQNLRFSGMLPAPHLQIEDGWQRVRVNLHAPHAESFWVAPIETVSESEGGFERVYQGSQILAVWRPNFTVQTSFSARLLWRVESL